MNGKVLAKKRQNGYRGKLRDWFVLFKFRADLANGMLLFLNLTLLSLAASPKLETYIPLPTHLLVIVVICVAFGWLIIGGYALDRGLQYWDTYQKEASGRNPHLMNILTIVEKIDKRIEKIEKHLNIQNK